MLQYQLYEIIETIELPQGFKKKPRVEMQKESSNEPPKEKKTEFPISKIKTKTESKPIAKEKTTEDLASEVAEFIKKMA